MTHHRVCGGWEASHLAYFNEAEEFVHLLVEASGPDLSLQHQTEAAASPFVQKLRNDAQWSIVCFFPLTLSSTISMEKSFPSPRELLHVLMLLLLVMRARIVHLPHTEYKGWKLNIYDCFGFSVLPHNFCITLNLNFPFRTNQQTSCIEMLKPVCGGHLQHC